MYTPVNNPAFNHHLRDMRIRRGDVIMVLTLDEIQERQGLINEIVSKIDDPARKIYQGCVIRGSDQAKVARLRELNIQFSRLGELNRK